LEAAAGIAPDNDEAVNLLHKPWRTATL